MPRLLLHLEGAAVFACATAAYFLTDGGGWLYALLLLAPDLSMLGYLVNARVGSVGYNLGHTYVGPLALLGAGLLLSEQWLPHLALIWLAHIGLDRMLGYGLKYPTHFKDTHLHRV